MAIPRYACRSRALPLVFLLLPCIPFFSAPALGQQIGATALKDFVGVGIWYSQGDMNFDAAKGSASDEVKGYSDVLPSSVKVAGIGIGLSFENWGVNFGLDEGEVDIKKNADINQTPDDASDDVFVRKASRTNREIVILFQPAKWFYIGFGRDTGKMEFEQISPSGAKETRRLGYENDYYALGLAIGFDPTKSETAPFVTVFTKIPVSRGDFSGTVTALGAGIFF